MADRPHLGALNLKAQGSHHRALFVCTGGMLRSATCAQMMAAVADWNTRNAGTDPSALPPVHENLVEWAEKVYCMEPHHAEFISSQYPWAQSKIVVLGIPDQYLYRDPQLIDLIRNKFSREIKEAESHVQ